MTEIWKFPLQLTDMQIVDMPRDAKVLTAQFQRGVLCLWAIVNPSAELSARSVWIVGTGNPFPDSVTKRHIATAQDGDLVWHVFMFA